MNPYRCSLKSAHGIACGSPEVNVANRDSVLRHLSVTSCEYTALMSPNKGETALDWPSAVLCIKHTLHAPHASMHKMLYVELVDM